MRDDGARFALVAFPAARANGKPTIISITEDALPAARCRRWIVLGRDSDVLNAELIQPTLISNPRRVSDPLPSNGEEA